MNSGGCTPLRLGSMNGLDMDPKRAGNRVLRLASGGERRIQHARRVGHDRRQERGHAEHADARRRSRRFPQRSEWR